MKRVFALLVALCLIMIPATTAEAEEVSYIKEFSAGAITTATNVFYVSADCQLNLSVYTDKSIDRNFTVKAVEYNNNKLSTVLNDGIVTVDIPLNFSIEAKKGAFYQISIAGDGITFASSVNVCLSVMCGDSSVTITDAADDLAVTYADDKYSNDVIATVESDGSGLITSGKLYSNAVTIEESEWDMYRLKKAGEYTFRGKAGAFYIYKTFNVDSIYFGNTVYVNIEEDSETDGYTYVKFSSLNGIRWATLNGRYIPSGTLVKEDGEYTLVVRDKMGLKRAVKFTVKKNEGFGIYN